MFPVVLPQDLCSINRRILINLILHNLFEKEENAWSVCNCIYCIQSMFLTEFLFSKNWWEPNPPSIILYVLTGRSFHRLASGFAHKNLFFFPFLYLVLGAVEQIHITVGSLVLHLPIMSMGKFAQRVVGVFPGTGTLVSRRLIRVLVVPGKEKALMGKQGSLRFSVHPPPRCISRNVVQSILSGVVKGSC